MTHPHPLVALIDEAIENAAESGFREHLGGSLIGRPCLRELWYSFRWAKERKFKGRLLRLFNRGHLEEFRFVAYLESIGFEVRAYSQRLLYDAETDTYLALDWGEPITENYEDVSNKPAHMEIAENLGVKLKQFRIHGVKGHFGGSLDGKLYLNDGQWLPDIPTDLGPGLSEFKTHNTKSFVFLVQNGVKKAKPEHWSQMQIYMDREGLKWGLYLAVNKNDDDLYAEVVFADPAEGERLLNRAEQVINAKQPPNRIGNHPSWVDCKWCDFAKVCHYGEPMARHCRTCVHATPVDDGRWHCGHWDAIIPSEHVIKGCDNYKAITD